jgi:hypothetical protein
MKRRQQGGPGVELGRGRVLFDAAFAQQDHLVGHAHGFGLVVGDVDHGHVQLLLQGADFAAHFLAQLGVEVGERLVHQADRGIGDDGAAQRHALLLAAGELRRAAFQQVRQAEDVGHALQARHSRPRLLAHAHAEEDVLAHVRCGNSA